jgi:hypothetical protein
MRFKQIWLLLSRCGIFDVGVSLCVCSRTLVVLLLDVREI